MKSFADQNKKLLSFDETFDSSNPKSCEERGVLLLKNRRAQMIEHGLDFPFDIESSRCSIQQAMLNRAGESLMSSVIQYVEMVERQVEAFNGIE